MEQHHTADDQSHYEISLTAGQAFVAFVLLLLSLAAAFTFGLMLGKGQADDRLVVQKETPVVHEAAVTPSRRDTQIVELGVRDDDFREQPASKPARVETSPVITELPKDAAPVETASDEAAPVQQAQAEPPPTRTPAAPAERPATPSVAVPHYAQLLSTSDQKAAEALAARLIDGGFLSAYVERGQTEKGPVFRVRVRFNSEAEAREAEPKLRVYSSEVWITRR